MKGLESINKISSASSLNGSFIGFALVLFIPSTSVFQKYLGVVGVVAYVAIATLALLFFSRYGHIFVNLLSKFTEREVFWLATLTFLIVALIFFVVYPIANSGIVGGGSDGDDALNIASTELLQGRYPYYPKTYLGNPISPLPGALLLAMPFVLLGNAAYQNLFWLFIFFVVTKSFFKDWRPTLLLLCIILTLSPIVLYTLVIGSDYISNSLYVLVFILWMMASIPQPNRSGWEKALPAILLGIGLSSRANFVLLLPLMFSALVKRAGWKPAIKYTAITSIIFLAITVPFYVYDPQGFSPLHTSNELGRFQSIIPFAGFIIPSVTGITALILAAFQSVSRNLNDLLKNCTIVLAFPILCGIVLSSIQSERIDFQYAFFGVFFIFFGAVSYGVTLLKSSGIPEAIT